MDNLLQQLSDLPDNETPRKLSRTLKKTALVFKLRGWILSLALALFLVLIISAWLIYGEIKETGSDLILDQLAHDFEFSLAYAKDLFYGLSTMAAPEKLLLFCLTLIASVIIGYIIRHYKLKKMF